MHILYWVQSQKISTDLGGMIKRVLLLAHPVARIFCATIGGSQSRSTMLDLHGLALAL